MQPVPRIFVSATSRDLRTARGLVAEGLRRMECLPIVQDDFPPDYKSVRDMLRTKIQDCNAVVHLAGFYHGAEPQPIIPGPDRRSFTQMEYEIAMELKLPCYVFLCGKDFPFDVHDPEPEDRQLLQLAHRDRLLKRDELFYEFASPEELANRTRELQLSVEGLRGELAKERRRRRMAMIAAVAALLIAVVGGIWMHGRQEKTEAVNVAQTSEIAALKAQLEGPTFIVGKVNAAMMVVRAQGQGTEEEMKATAIKMVALELKKTEEVVKGSIEEATKVAQQLITAAQAEGKNDPTKLAASRQLEADTLQKLADAHLAAGRVNEAVVALQKRLELLDRDKDPEAWVYASEALAEQLRERNSFEEGLKVTRDAFEWAKTSKTFGPEHPTTLRLMLGVADATVASSFSRELAGFVLKARERDLGPDHVDTLEAVKVLARLAASAGETEKLYRQVIAAQTQALGAEHKETLKTMRLLALALQKIWKDYTGAEKLLVKVLEIEERTLGQEHAATLNTMALLASLKRDQKDYTESIKLNRKALAIYERTEGPDGKKTLIVLNNLAVAVRNSEGPGYLDEAIALYDRVLQTRIRTFGAAQADTLMAFSNLAYALEEKGDIEGGKALRMRMLDEQEKAVGKSDTAFLNNLDKTITHYKDEKDYATALSLAKRRLKLHEATQPEGALDTLDALVAVASLEDELDNITEAVRLSRLLIELVERKQPDLKIFLAQSYNNLSYFLSRLGEQAEALTQMRKCVEISQVAFNANDATRGKYETRLKKMEGEAKAPAGTIAKASKSDKAAPSADRYADFRKTVDDKIESEKWRKVYVTLTASRSGGEAFLVGWFDSEGVRKVMHVDSADDNNQTLTFYYWSEGWLTSVYQLQTGSDVPIKGVDELVDIHSFQREKLVIWTQNADGEEKVMDSNDPDFSENGQRVIAAGNEAKELVLQADKAPDKPAATKPLAATAKKTETPSLEDYAAFQKEVDEEAKSAGWKEVKQDLPGVGNERRVYLRGWFEGKQLRKLLSVDTVGEEGGTFKFYYWTKDGTFTSAFCRRKGTSVLVKGAKETTDTYNFFNQKFVSWEWSQDDQEHVMDPSKEFFEGAGKKVQAEAEEGLKIIQKAFTDGPTVVTADKAPPVADDTPPPLKTYLDFRIEINDKIKAGGFKTTTLKLAAETDRRHYIEGEWNGDKMERAFELNKLDEENYTMKFYYFNQHGMLMSIYEVKEGVDAPDNVKKSTDAFNFYKGELVSWRNTKDEVELMIGPDVKGFKKLGTDKLADANELTGKLLKAGPNPK